MQIADLPATSIASLAEAASASAIDILYFADSMGSLTPERTRAVVDYFRQGWQGDLGIHTHDNLGLALANTLAAADAGVEWVDSTVTGMGRGPGNVKTEDLAVEWIERRAGRPGSVIPLLGVIDNYFAPLQKTYGWGKNPYYYLAGRYGIHPTYVQAMIDDSRYGPEDILAAIEHLRVEGGKRFCADTLDSTRQFYQGPARGSWEPADAIRRREVLIVGAGPSVHRHQAAIERFIEKHEPYVIALNTDSAIAPNLIDARIACHPIRLLADCRAHVDFPQPLITPASMLPSDVRESLEGKQLYDYGLSVEPGTFSFSGTSCTVPSTLVAAYALAVATGGSARRIWLAGFDGYGPEDRRTVEMQRTVSLYESCSGALSLTSLTPTSYSIPVTSVYAL
jgi:4-hydroxy 2-oxovalerate aldolase